MMLLLAAAVLKQCGVRRAQFVFAEGADGWIDSVAEER